MINKEYETYKVDYKERYKDYEFSIYWPYEERLDLENELIGVILKTKQGQRYSAEFTTLKFIEELFKKNKRTQENVSGAYVAIPNLILVRNLKESTIKATIDDLIDKLAIEAFFKIIDN